MIRLATVIDTFEADFLAQYRHRLRPEHERALAAIRPCRTQARPKMQARCSACAHQTLVPPSCGHRHGPHHESQPWLERPLKKQVPVEYFLLTFTRPAQFRALAFAHQGVVYELLLCCAWETVRTFSQNDRPLRGTPGAIAVLHTNTRRLDFHPPVHLVMPAAAIDGERKEWRTRRRSTSRGGDLFNHKALAKVFRAKRLAGLEAAGLTLPKGYPGEGVVDGRSVGSGEPALIDLGRYLSRGVIREQDIESCDNGQVTFRYRHAQTGRTKRRTVSGAAFLWLVLQHVRPKGFRRARNYGFLHPNCKRLIALLHVLLQFAPGRSLAWVRERTPLLCACGGAAMVIVRTRIRVGIDGGSPVPISAAGAC